MIGLWDQIDYGEKINKMLKSNPDESEVIITMRKAVVRSENGQGVNLRKEKSTKSELILKIPEGANLEVLETDDRWSHVTYGTKTGYVINDYIMIDDDVINIRLSKTAATALRDALTVALTESEGVG